MKIIRLLLTPCAFASAACNISLPTNQWPGWQGISRLVVFGDSYSTTGFNDTLAQPSTNNPLGNPTYPGYTASNGPNWVDYMTVNFNDTLVETLNLAYGGATLDSALVAPYLPTVLSLKQQVQQEFLPKYGSSSNQDFTWEPTSTLFTSVTLSFLSERQRDEIPLIVPCKFIGINDIGNSYANANRSQIYPQIFSEYKGLLEQIYDSGARNFAFINVPPVNRSPLTKAAGPSTQQVEKGEIAAWNKNVTILARSLKSEHEDASVFVYDANSLWTEVLDNPCSFQETCAYKNTTTYCPACQYSRLVFMTVYMC